MVDKRTNKVLTSGQQRVIVEKIKRETFGVNENEDIVKKMTFLDDILDYLLKNVNKGKEKCMNRIKNFITKNDLIDLTNHIDKDREENARKVVEELMKEAERMADLGETFAVIDTTKGIVLDRVPDNKERKLIRKYLKENHGFKDEDIEVGNINRIRGFTVSVKWVN